eukprot:scaffold1727_cov133-Cylindrotheca_fusiformis.AAC.21
MSEIIDLCSSDEDQEVNQAKQSYLEFSSDEDDLQEEGAVVKPKEAIVTPDAAAKSTSSDGEERKPNARRSLFAKSKQSDPWESDSSSDDELLNYKALSLRKTKPSQPESLARTHSKKGKMPISSSKENNTLPSPLPETKKVRMHSPISGSISRAPTNLLNPYATRPAKIGAVNHSLFHPREESGVVYPSVGRSDQYDDIRTAFILAFWKYAQKMEHASHNLVKLDRFSKRVNALALSQFPIRSVEEYCQRFASVTDITNIEAALSIGEISVFRKHIARSDGKYFSIAEACLVSMLEHVESASKTSRNGNQADLKEEGLSSVLQERNCRIYLSELIPMIDRRLKDICPGRLTRRDEEDNGASYYSQKSTRSAEFAQIEKLQRKQRNTGFSYIRARKQQGQVCYELTPAGYKTAKFVKKRNFPCRPGYYRTSNLDIVEPRFQGICLAVDNREGGGPKKKLHFMCNKLDTLKIPYFVCSLNMGDYCFFAGNKLLPVIIERKSIQDIAQSIYDGRWANQKKRMYQGQYVFGYNNCCMAYIIEGRKDTQELSDGYIGQRQFNVSSEALDQAIEELESEGVLHPIPHRTSDHSMVELSRWAMRMLQDYRDKKLEVTYTYEEFQNEVKKIPSSVDFSRIARDMAKGGRPKTALESSDTPVKSEKKPGAKQTRLEFGKAKATMNDYKGWTVAQLQKQCSDWGLPKGGKKADLIDRLNGPRPPKVLLQRKARDLYVPSRYNTCATALLVALWLEQRNAGADWKGMPKEELYALAESLNISKDPFSGISTGVFKYDGWSSMSDLKSGEFPLVVLKRGHFKLSASTGVSGMPLAEALHGWCHEHGKCCCQTLGYN